MLIRAEIVGILTVVTRQACRMDLRRWCFSLVLLLFGTVACSSRPTAPSPGPTEGASDNLRVALYPYVPRLQQFKDVLQRSWRHPDIGLEFVDWDGYSSDPPADLDVFVFDAIFFDHFVAKGYLSPIPRERIVDIDDFLPYAIEGSQIDGTHYAIPQLGCASLLFYRDGDQELARARTLEDIENALGNCTYLEEQPPPGVGLMIDMSGGTTNASYYIEAQQDLAHAYTPTPALPTAEKLDPAVVAQLERVLALASMANATYENDDHPYQRAAWFADGAGRATVGFTESMSVMGEARDRVDFKPLPLDGQPDISLFYSDLIGVNSTINDPKEREAAFELANLLASRAYLVASFGPGSANSPQYLMPVRDSVFQELGQSFPLYREMRQMVESVQPRLFRLGPSARSWLEGQKSAIRARIQAEPHCKAGS